MTARRGRPPARSARGLPPVRISYGLASARVVGHRVPARAAGRPVPAWAAACLLLALVAGCTVWAAAGSGTPAMPGTPGPTAAATGTPGGEGAAERAGAVRLEAVADRTAITVGDPIVLTLRLRYPKGTRIASFAPERSLGALVLLDQRSEAPRTIEDGRVEEVRTLRVTVFETGAVELPALEASYVDPQGREGKAASAAVPITVASVLAAGDLQPADIKPPADMPEPFRWPWILLGIAALAAAAAWWWRRRSRRPVEAVTAPQAPPRPPHEIAYGELERLLAAGLLEAGRIKEFYIELAEIVKRYLEGRYGVDTFEKTSAEILEALRAARIPVRTTASAGDFFAACDLVKFARLRPLPEETRSTVERAYRLVDETRAPEAAPPDPGAAVAAGAARGAAAGHGAGMGHGGAAGYGGGAG